ncbi:tumor necrosis factor ligand superfamily member 15 [Thamnophis elegans]|uniref:tumor necrosis factor ligand superfamily member 15 n=1 Tax=Thamnophis elegans TaxID=35005 RepID=UPI0013783656|nr:tumor necrosis factor ligand superfamily member 15 [Thamnophis elegans]
MALFPLLQTLMERMPEAQKQHGEPLCKQCDSTIQPNVYARANSNVSQSKCVNGIWANLSLLWNIQSEVGDFQLDKERISLIIPKDGRYFVYSQVTFSCFRCNCEEDRCCRMKSKTVWLKMQYKTPAYENSAWTDFLISTSRMENNSINSVYVGGIKLLEKGDRVMVTVSHPGLVEPDQYYTFFGAYFIS